MKALGSPYKGSGALTREQFLFYEMRTTARLLVEGLETQAVYDHIVSDNLFQYPTEREIRSITMSCIKRLKGLNNEALIQMVAESPAEEAKQCCLYAMMKQYRLIWDFMITVIGEKYRQQDFNFCRRDINVFFMRLQEQDDLVAGWSEGTVKKIVSVISRILMENNYIDDAKSERLNPVLISRFLEDAIKENGDDIALAAFNCLT